MIIYILNNINSSQILELILQVLDLTLILIQVYLKLLVFSSKIISLILSGSDLVLQFKYPSVGVIHLTRVLRVAISSASSESLQAVNVILKT
jgi:hypothetical protein